MAKLAKQIILSWYAGVAAVLLGSTVIQAGFPDEV